jgi:hypothetical protein
MSAFKSFQEWWLALPLTLRERMNLHDAEFVWLARESEFKRLERRIELLEEQINGKS